MENSEQKEFLITIKKLLWGGQKLIEAYEKELDKVEVMRQENNELKKKLSQKKK